MSRVKEKLAPKDYETGFADGVEKCLADIDYVREFIRVTPKGRVRFDVYDLNTTFKNACTVIRERITDEDKDAWVAPESELRP